MPLCITIESSDFHGENLCSKCLSTGSFFVIIHFTSFACDVLELGDLTSGIYQISAFYTKKDVIPHIVGAAWHCLLSSGQHPLKSP